MAAFTFTGHLEWDFTIQSDYDAMLTRLANVAPNVALSNLTRDPEAMVVSVDVVIQAPG